MALHTKKDVDMINGSLWNKIIIFAIPIAISALLQQLFHSADTAVVGKFAGKAELAAVGSNGSIINLLVNFFMGLSVGANVIISQFIGARQTAAAKKSIYTSLVIALVSGIIIMVAGVLLSRAMLELVSSPDDVIDLATLYLRIYFLGAPFIMLYNFSAAICRSRGDTVKPFICLLSSGILNLILNLIFVIVFKWGVAGVAIATVLSNILSSGMMIVMLCRDKTEFGISLKEIKVDWLLTKKIIKIGLPVGIQSCLFPISNMMVQSSINSLGTAVIAGWAVGSSVDSYSFNLMSGFDQANITFVSQNYGAGKIDRCRKVTRMSILFNLILVNLFNLLMYIFMDKVVALFTSDAEVMLIAKQRISFMYMIFSTGVIQNGLVFTLRGLGYSFVPTLVSVVGICGFRILWLMTMFKKVPELITILVVYPVSWSIVALILAVMYFFIIKKIQRKKLN